MEQNDSTRIVFREKKNTYKSVNMHPSRDRELSFKARGILYYLYGMSETWKGQVYDLVRSSNKDGVASIRAGLKELRELGYARIVTPPKKDGKFQGKYYEVSDTPIYKDELKK